jgi:hypothetical protein
VSTRGGLQPFWRGDGKELYYLALDGKIMSVTVNTTGEFAADVPAMLFDPRLPIAQVLNMYAPSPDGQRFLVDLPESGGRQDPMTLVLNWNAEMKRK